MKNLTQKQLKEILDYNSETGEFTWKIDMGIKIKAGDIAGSKHSVRYWQICYKNKRYFAHRLAWIYMYGTIPEGLVINHREFANGTQHCNRISNLEVCTRQQNNAYKKKCKKNTSGYKGVSWSKELQKWRAYTSYYGKYIHIGYFDSKLKAAEAYNKKAQELFRGFALINDIGAISNEKKAIK